MHLQENALFDFDFGFNVTQIVVTYAPAKFEIASSKNHGLHAFI